MYKLSLFQEKLYFLLLLWDFFLRDETKLCWKTELCGMEGEDDGEGGGGGGGGWE